MAIVSSSSESVLRRNMTAFTEWKLNTKHVNSDVKPTTIFANRSICGSIDNSNKAARSSKKIKNHTHTLSPINKLIALNVISAFVNKSMTLVKLMAKNTYDV